MAGEEGEKSHKDAQWGTVRRARWGKKEGEGEGRREEGQGGMEKRKGGWRKGGRDEYSNRSTQ